MWTRKVKFGLLRVSSWSSRRTSRSTKAGPNKTPWGLVYIYHSDVLTAHTSLHVASFSLHMHDRKHAWDEPADICIPADVCLTWTAVKCRTSSIRTALPAYLKVSFAQNICQKLNIQIWVHLFGFFVTLLVGFCLNCPPPVPPTAPASGKPSNLPGYSTSVCSWFSSGCLSVFRDLFSRTKCLRRYRYLWGSHTCRDTEGLCWRFMKPGRVSLHQIAKSFLNGKLWREVLFVLSTFWHISLWEPLWFLKQKSPVFFFFVLFFNDDWVTKAYETMFWSDIFKLNIS